MKTSFYVDAIWRESRGSLGHLAFFVACLAVGVSAVVGVACAGEAVGKAVRAQSRELLGADLTVSVRRPLPEELEAFFASVPGTVERTDALELPTMAATASGEGVRRSRLVEVMAVDGDYPLRGALELSTPGSLRDLLSPESAVIGPQLLEELGIATGGRIQLGDADFQVRALVLDEPSRLDFSMVLGPRVFISRAGFERTGLLTFGSQITYRSLFRLADDLTSGDLAKLKRRLADEVPGAAYLRVESHDQAQPMVRRGLRRLGNFLGLVSLLSLLLGGVGVAQIIRTWLSSRTQNIAVLRCLGLRPREILILYLAHVGVVALLGSVLGCGLGSLTPLMVSSFAGDLLGGLSLSWWQPLPLLRGLALGVSVAMVFSLPVLTALWRVSPARVLRASAAPLPVPGAIRWGVSAIVISSVFFFSWIQGGRLEWAFEFTSALLVVSLLLFLGARGLLWLVGNFPRTHAGPYLRHGLAALARPGAGTTGAIVALGLGILVVSTVYFVEARLDLELESEFPKDTPSVYLWDVQRDQDEGVRKLLQEEGSEMVTSVPVVMARIAAVDGVAVEDLVPRKGRRRRSRWAVTREQRLTWFEELPKSNRVVSGALWSDPEQPEVSLEEGYARRLGAELGTVLRFDIQGVAVDLVVTSLRDVDWESFEMNFYVVAEPGVLDQAPQFRMVGVRLPPEAELGMQSRLVGAYPNISVIRVRSILEQVIEMLHRLALGVRLLGGFTIAVGLIVLAGAVSATTIKRARESGLLRTLGLTRRGVALLLLIEYGLTGVVAGTLGTAGALALSHGFLEWVLELESQIPYLSSFGIVIASGVLTALCGLVASTRALQASPAQVFREF